MYTMSNDNRARLIHINYDCLLTRSDKYYKSCFQQKENAALKSHFLLALLYYLIT